MLQFASKWLKFSLGILRTDVAFPSSFWFSCTSKQGLLFFFPCELKIVSSLEVKEIFLITCAFLYISFQTSRAPAPNVRVICTTSESISAQFLGCLPLSWAPPPVWWFDVSSYKYAFKNKTQIIVLMDLHEKVRLVIQSADVKKKELEFHRVWYM